METSGFVLDSSTPVFQVIDNPESPLGKEESSALKAIILGGVIGAVIIMLLLFLIRSFKRIMTE